MFAKLKWLGFDVFVWVKWTLNVSVISWLAGRDGIGGDGTGWEERGGRGEQVSACNFNPLEFYDEDVVCKVFVLRMSSESSKHRTMDIEARNHRTGTTRKEIYVVLAKLIKIKTAQRICSGACNS